MSFSTSRVSEDGIRKYRSKTRRNQHFYDKHDLSPFTLQLSYPIHSASQFTQPSCLRSPNRPDL